MLICKWMVYFENPPNTESKASTHLSLPNGSGWGTEVGESYSGISGAPCQNPQAFISHLF